MYKAIAASATGVSHLRDHRPCQDCSYAFTSADGLTAAIIAADGHGSHRHTRSDIGSKLACDAARKLFSWLEFFLPAYSEQLEHDHRWIAEMIIAHFKASVDAHVLSHPLSQQEEKLLQKCDVYHLYGTTLLAVFSSPAYSIAIAVGDGAICSLEANGSPHCLLPTPVTENPSICPGSLCNLSADDFRIHFQHGPLQSAAVITDGISNSFADDGIELCTVLMQDMQEYEPEIHVHLYQLLKDVTANGVGDDVSIAVLAQQK